MHFRLTYAGRLLSTANDGIKKDRSSHKHDIRRVFHKQLQRLWAEHPVLSRGHSTAPVIGSLTMKRDIHESGFVWRPIATEKSGLICELDILMLRAGEPSKVIHDIDNRLKTIFDALRKPSEQELGTKQGMLKPQDDENPFYVLMDDDKLITRVSVTSDMLLEPVNGVQEEGSVRLFIGVTIKPYAVSIDNLDFA